MRVLVIEDEQRLAQSLKRGLEADGFAVDIALDGDNGLWMAREHDGDPNIVEVYIRYLRRKIDVAFGRRPIETVRGAGYRLAADGG